MWTFQKANTLYKSSVLDFLSGLIDLERGSLVSTVFQPDFLDFLGFGDGDLAFEVKP